LLIFACLTSQAATRHVHLGRTESISWPFRQVLGTREHHLDWGGPPRPAQVLQLGLNPLQSHRRAWQQHVVWRCLGLCLGPVFASPLIMWWLGECIWQYDIGQEWLLDP
jgi:hypothetical protein